tara:strand:- start:9853 stop:10011 length:159 start_codon:yes stop_codon:yes gene_type:complete
MHPKNQGLTVGELTITITILLVISLVWSGLNKRNESKNSFTPLEEYHLSIKV